MKNKQWLQKWLDTGSYTNEDILHIVGKQLVVEPAQPYTHKDVLTIVGPPTHAATSSGTADITYP